VKLSLQNTGTIKLTDKLEIGKNAIYIYILQDALGTQEVFNKILLGIQKVFNKH